MEADSCSVSYRNRRGVAVYLYGVKEDLMFYTGLNNFIFLSMLMLRSRVSKHSLSCINRIWRSRPCLAENFFPQQAQGRTSSDIP
ncbi:hypothetical protein KSF78_0009718 [Schistosoma japonicum]|nr:hypothetical protein KSF78_0009718 [Schistosoma japonicum]